MLKLTVAVLAVALASSASAAGWRSLRIDASSEEAFKESVAVFEKKLAPSRWIAFARSLQDVWADGTRLAEEQQREYTSTDYLRQLHGLGYAQVVTLADPTGKKEGFYRAEYYARGSGGVPSAPRQYPDASAEHWTSSSGIYGVPRGSTGGYPPITSGPRSGACLASPEGDIKC